MAARCARYCGLKSNHPPRSRRLSMTLSDTFSARPFYYAPPSAAPLAIPPVAALRSISSYNKTRGDKFVARQSRSKPNRPDERTRGERSDDNANGATLRLPISSALISHKGADNLVGSCDYDLGRLFPFPETLFAEVYVLKDDRLEEFVVGNMFWTP